MAGVAASANKTIAILLANPYSGRRLKTIENIAAIEGLDIAALFIPFGKKWQYLEDMCRAKGFDMVRQVKKADYEAALAAVNPTIVFSIGWPFIVGDKVRRVGRVGVRGLGGCDVACSRYVAGGKCAQPTFFASAYRVSRLSNAT